MLKELVAITPRKLTLIDYDNPSLKSNQVRIKSVFSVEKHEAKLLICRGLSLFSEKSFNPNLGFFMPKHETVIGIFKRKQLKADGVIQPVVTLKKLLKPIKCLMKN
jgi:hypothetical protein